MRARLLTRELIELPEKFAAFVETTNQRLDTLEAGVQSLKTDVQGLRDDMGILKGAHARNVAREDAATIARAMGLRCTKTLTRDELWDLTEAVDTSGIPPNVLRSFRRADLIMEAADPTDEPCYIAVEISFTANGRGTTRAIRNAEFLTKYTGKPARAAIAGLRHDHQIQAHIDSGIVFWYQLEPADLEAE